MAFPSLLTNAIAQDPDILDLDLHDVPGLRKTGGLRAKPTPRASQTSSPRRVRRVYESVASDEIGDPLVLGQFLTQLDDLLADNRPPALSAINRERQQSHPLAFNSFDSLD